MPGIQDIILKRFKVALIGICLIIIGGVYGFAHRNNAPTNVLNITILGVLLIAFIVLALINLLNYRTPRLYYRKVNRWLYNFGTKSMAASDAFSAGKNLTNFANPLEQMGNPGANKKTDLLDFAANAYTAGKVWPKEWKAADIVEAYYVSQQQKPTQNQPPQTPGQME